MSGRCIHCGQLKDGERRPAYLVRRDFESALQTLGIPEEKLIAKSTISGRSMQRQARQRFLVAYWLWTRGGHESDVGQVLQRHRVTIIHALQIVTKALKSSQALSWRIMLDRLDAGATEARRAA